MTHASALWTHLSPIHFESFHGREKRPLPVVLVKVPPPSPFAEQVVMHK